MVCLFGILERILDLSEVCLAGSFKCHHFGLRQRAAVCCRDRKGRFCSFRPLCTADRLCDRYRRFALCCVLVRNGVPGFIGSIHYRAVTELPVPQICSNCHCCCESGRGRAPACSPVSALCDRVLVCPACIIQVVCDLPEFCCSCFCQLYCASCFCRHRCAVRCCQREGRLLSGRPRISFDGLGRLNLGLACRIIGIRDRVVGSIRHCCRERSCSFILSDLYRRRDVSALRPAVSERRRLADRIVVGLAGTCLRIGDRSEASCCRFCQLNCSSCLFRHRRIGFHCCQREGRFLAFGPGRSH